MSEVASKGLPRNCRLLTPAQFGVVLSARGEGSFRRYGKWFSVQALRTAEPGRIRVGLTVGKHLAHRAVDRVLVKRILRESAGNIRSELSGLAGSQDFGLDIALRLKAPFPTIGEDGMGLRETKALLREDADRLLGWIRTAQLPRQ